eukprot:CAMPEP_0114553860 /NCGR_PEP_ID=MMETSP0114-20121206/7893_1 /TAXON_ID=31324 /ORGANISM="Goniomonas sp, Strain m" /LENGTH=673 /DNA_ID=CAMNT_0001738851 /DNA_START=30 /DNA_END=2051 /DNA_ORIENTATION=+
MENMEPSTDSTDKEERIRARKDRIGARIAAKEAGELDPSLAAKKKDVDSRDIRKGKQQIVESRQRLEKVKSEGIEIVTDVRVKGDERENNRRIAAESHRQERRQKLLFEAENSSRRNAAIAMKWMSLFDMEVPLDLLRAMEAQKEGCDKIIAQKDELIREFQMELKSKDEEYVKALKKDAHDVDHLLGNMTEQFYDLHHAYEQELEDIEAKFREERKNLLEQNKAEIENLLEKRRNMEQAHMEARQRRVEEDQVRLERLRLHDAEDYTNLKIRLETEIQKLEQQLEEMRSTYQLNTEKLEYNFRVLTERDYENQNTINQQKRKLGRLHDVLSSLTARYWKKEKDYKQENMDLTDEYRRITEQFKDLQLKYKHFENTDRKRFEEVWRMKEQQVKELLSTLLKADKLVHEQQLGLSWFPPSQDALNTAFDEARTRAMQQGKKKAQQERTEDSKLKAADLVGQPHVHAMLRLLTDEAGFLVESKVRKALDSVDKEDGDLMRIDAILKALGVESEEGVAKLMNYFVQEDDMGATELVEADDVVRCLRAFVQDITDDGKRAGFPRAEDLAGTGGLVGGEVEGKEKRQHQKEARDIWEVCGNVIAPKTFRVWGALERFLHKYNTLLSDRARAIQDCEGMRTQNMELKMLLNQYLGSKINHELYVPPTATIGRLARPSHG